MTVEVNETLTGRIAALARLELTQDEVTRYTKQLRDMLAYVEAINEVDVSNVQPLAQPFEAETPFREDRVENFLLTHSDGYKVPPII